MAPPKFKMLGQSAFGETVGRDDDRFEAGHKVKLFKAQLGLAKLAAGGFLVLIVAVLVGSKWGSITGGLSDTVDSIVGDGKTNAVSARRSCLATETICTAARDCMGADGRVAAATAIAPDGRKCCALTCEGDSIPTRTCKITETLCGQGQACASAAGGGVQVPEAITPGGRSCCRFQCASAEDGVPQRACLAGETLCGKGSNCVDYLGNTVAPAARTSAGLVCCKANGRGADQACTVAL